MLREAARSKPEGRGLKMRFQFPSLGARKTMPELNQNANYGNEAFISLLASRIADGSDLSPDDLGGLKQFLSGGVSSSILPTLDMHLLKRQLDGIQIVRHVGMVQNMLDPEFYVSNLNGRSLHFRDCNPTTFNVESNDSVEDFSNLAERQPLFIVPIPFTAGWFQELLMVGEGSFDERRIAGSIMTSTSRKRDRETVDLKNSKQRSEEVKILDHIDDYDISKRVKSQKRPVAWWPAGCNESDECSSPILAKFYYDQYAKVEKMAANLRLNDIVETIGVLSINPWEADFSTPGSNFDFDSPPPPPSQLPRLHVLTYRTVDLDTLVHERVLASTKSTEEIMGATLNSGLKKSLAAEALFLTMLSKAERKASRVHRMSTSAIGCASLKVTSTVDSREVFRRLKNVLHQSCPVLAAVDLASKEEHPFPVKSRGIIAPTCWQLPAGSTLLIHLGDSCQRRLEQLLSSHQILYTFEGGVEISFEADYRIIVISNNQNVKCSLHVCCEEEDLSMLEEEEELRLRRTLALCRRVGNVKLSPEVLERAQDDFLSQRSSARSNQQTRMPQEDDFHRWLCLTRLQARSRNSDIATTEDWEQAFALDNGVWNSLN